jgi:N-acetylglucosamine-6-phosphate deacetylase
MKYIIKAKEIYSAKGILNDTGVLVEDGKIVGVGVEENSKVTEINLQKYKVLPGLIDMHIHGVNGFDTMDATYHSLNEISKYLAYNGVTSFLATTVTSSLDKIGNAISNVNECINKGLDGARVLGSYIEGPYITKEHKGAHPESFIREININEIEGLVSKSNNTVKVMTLAPEKKNVIEAIHYLKNNGIKVSMGHTNASYREAIEAVENGAEIAVHIFNGMRGLQNREAGMLGAALIDDRINVEMICDCVHVDIPLMQIAVRCKKNENLLLITDCMMAGGLKDGEYILGELKVLVKEDIARVESGSLAGSTLKLIDAVKNMVEKVGVPLKDAVNMATINPARVIGIDKELGSIELGKIADIIAVDDGYNIVFTMIGGKVLYLRDVFTGE